MYQYLSNSYAIELVGLQPYNENIKFSLRLVKRLLWLSVLVLAATALLIIPAEANPSLTATTTRVAQAAGPECLETVCSEDYDTAVANGLIAHLSVADQESLALLDNTPLYEARTAIVQAAYKYQVPVGFFTGIAYAESSVHQNYFIESDRDTCHNPWGLKPKEGQRADGSYLICFNSWDESTEYFAKMLKDGYLDRGARTVESIAPYYKCGGPDGADWCLVTMTNWIRNVHTYSYF